MMMIIIIIIIIIIITKTLYQNTCSVALQQLTARIALVITFEVTFRIPNIEASIVFFLQVITFRSYTVHSSKSVTIACEIGIVQQSYFFTLLCTRVCDKLAVLK